MPQDTALESSIAEKDAGHKAVAGVLSYGCTSAAGATTGHFWRGLREARDHSRELPLGTPPFRACLWDRPWDAPRRELLVVELLKAWEQARSGLSPPARARLERSGRLGVILASTKGDIDDWIWGEAAGAHERDSLTGILDEFVARCRLRPALSLCVSNACASSLSGLYLARSWFEARACDEVLLLAADAVGPFVLRGFRALRALTEDRCRPFARDRSGLTLGEAAAAIILSRGSDPEAELAITGVGLDAEGFAATRPKASGESLLRACRAAPGHFAGSPELIIAHGTGTSVNDECEDSVFGALFGDRPPISATKGSIGHCLGASGAMDLIAACEAIRRRELFPITGTSEADPAFRGRYQVGKPADSPPRSVLVTSLGFGGIHAAARVELSGREGVE